MSTADPQKLATSPLVRGRWADREQPKGNQKETKRKAQPKPEGDTSDPKPSKPGWRHTNVVRRLRGPHLQAVPTQHVLVSGFCSPLQKLESSGKTPVRTHSLMSKRHGERQQGVPVLRRGYPFVSLKAAKRSNTRTKRPENATAVRQRGRHESTALPRGNSPKKDPKRAQYEPA